jgi:hypothetical protein
VTHAATRSEQSEVRTTEAFDHLEIVANIVNVNGQRFLVSESIDSDMLWRAFTNGAGMAISKKKFMLRALIVVLLAFITFGYFVNRVPKPTIASAVGKPAPNFVLSDQDGKDFSLVSQQGHKVLLMFYRGYW